MPSGCRGIVNPNYPGFQHLAPSLLSDTDLTEDEHESCPADYIRLTNDIDARPTENDSAENDNECNNNVEDSINHLCGQRNERKIFYEKPKFNIQVNNSRVRSKRSHLISFWHGVLQFLIQQWINIRINSFSVAGNLGSCLVSSICIFRETPSASCH